MKKQIWKLHRIAEFQKKLAWANYNAAKNSTMFKTELEACAKQAANHCRQTRQQIRDMINSTDDRQALQAWADAGAPDNYLD